MRASNYDKSPCVPSPTATTPASRAGMPSPDRLRQAIANRAARKTRRRRRVLHRRGRRRGAGGNSRIALRARAGRSRADALLPPERIDALVAPFLGGDDPVFGFLSGLKLPQFFDEDRLRQSRAGSRARARGLVLVVGCGARLMAGRRHSGLCRPRALGGAVALPPQRDQQSRRREPDARGQPAIQARVLRRLARGRPLEAPAHRAMGFRPRHQQPARAEAGRRRGRAARLASRGDAAVPRRAVLRSRAVGRAVDEGGLRSRPQREPNYGWCFDCVPEENSLLLGFGATRVRDSLDRSGVRPAARAARRGGSRAVRRRVSDPLRFSRHDGRRQSVVPGPSAHRIHPAAFRHALHAGRELLHARCRAGRERLSRLARGRGSRRRCCAIWRAAQDGRRAFPGGPIRQPVSARRSTIIF